MSVFTIEKDVHCQACGHGEWLIVGADRVALGVSFESEEAAEEYLEVLEIGAAAERARIRRELFGWYGGDTGEESFPTALDRILPEEG